MFTALSLLWFLLVLGVAAVALATANALYAAVFGAGAGRRAALWTAGGFGLVWVVWAAVTTALAAAHVYRFQADAVKPWLAVGFAVPLVALLALSRVPVVARALAHPAARVQLIRPHQVRIMGVAFLLALAMGDLPPAFAWPAALGDITIGLSATRVIRRLRAGDGDRSALWLNIFGIADFVYAFAVAILAAPGPTRALHLTPSTEHVSLLPLVLVPTAAVPVLFTLHVLSLANSRAAQPVTAVPVAA
ncbi:hypothetical protein [Nocardia sp. alder85J]|uniref:hypothetical protein n=1 Tax=Nocardia sp. alder85J TaxID=2862949 RepID=UPI001CD626E6|nr:hypothetical protein [Nocardia sp. alder85J]MCX4092541.1 hypothetical protein [Nocardia sp. alder85J]